MKTIIFFLTLFSSISTYSTVALAATPELTQITPSPVVGCMHPREFSLSGSGFEKDLRIQVVASGVNKFLEDNQVEFVDEYNAKFIINTLEAPDKWVVLVRNGDGPFSNPANIVIKAPPVTPPAQGELGAIIGNFKGVNARSNGACTGVLNETCMSNYLCNAPYQCVDYAKRYYKINYPNITETGSRWDTAQAFWERSKHPNLNKTIYPRNGLQKEDLPYPGDMIFFNTKHPTGHVAIITNVTEDKIELIQQNIDRYTAEDALIVTHDEETGLTHIGQLRNKYDVIGWLSPLAPIPSGIKRKFETLDTSTGWLKDDYHVQSEGGRYMAFRRCMGDKDKPNCFLHLNDKQKRTSLELVVTRDILESKEAFANYYPIFFKEDNLYYSNRHELFVYDLSKKTSRNIAQDSWSATVSPNKQLIAYMNSYRSGGANLWVLDLNSNIKKSITSNPGSDPGNIYWLDDHSMLFEIRSTSKPWDGYETWRINKDGKNLTKLGKGQVFNYLH